MKCARYLLPSLLTVLSAPFEARGQTAERVFASRSPSIVVVHAGNDRQGSGVVVASSLVATNCHVLEGADAIVVRRGRISHAAHRAWTQSVSDICLLDAPTLDAPPSPIGRAANLRVGSTVFAIGAPAGLELSLSAGIVSQLRHQGGAPLVQTSAPMSPGSSGGGLFDERAQLVGITTMFARDGQNLNFAVPAEWLASAIVALNEWRQCRASPDAACLADAARTMGHATSNESASVDALIAIARAYLGSGRRDAAEALLGDALVAARLSEAASMPRAIFNVAIAFREARLSQRAAELLHEAVRANASIASTPSNDGWQPAPMFVEDFVRAFLDLNDFAAAMTVARSLPPDDSRASVLVQIATAQIEGGNNNEARQTLAEALISARRAQEPRARARALGDVASILSRAGDRQDAVRTRAESLAAAEGIDDEFLRDRVLIDLLEQQVRDGDASGALARARRIPSSYERTLGLSKIAEAQAANGSAAGAGLTLDEAIRLARVESSASRDWSRLAIARAQARSGRVVEALALAREIGDPEPRVSALISIARQQLATFDTAGAAQTIAEALAQASEISRGRTRSARLGNIAELQAGIGEVDAALATLSGVTEGHDLYRALASIAEAQTRRGDFSGVVGTRRRIVAAVHRSPSNLRAVAEAQARAGDVPGAISTLDEIDDQPARIGALGTVAAILAMRP